MKRLFVLACAGLSFGLLTSPLAAQEMALAVPEAQQLPPPPPFPPMPSSKPSHRFVDVGGHRTSRARAKASPARHHASSVKHDRKARASKKDRATHKARTRHQGSKAGASHRSVRKDKPMHFSAKTVRSCHAMTYRQILRNSSCRSMIKQELAATPTKARSSHKASAKHSSSRAKTARRHSTAKKRRR